MKKLLYCCILLLAFSCKEKYISPYIPPAKGYLVVDGIINSGQGATTIRLSRTIVLADSGRAKNETKALVRVEGENNTSFVLPETAQGTYSINQLILNNNVKYRLYVKTTDGKEYLSDFAKPIKTPPIDNIRWEQPYDLQLYINTHDPQNNTRYYRWEFEETWEFHSAFYTQLKYIKNQFGESVRVDYLYPDQHFDQSIFKCWTGNTSTSLLIGSSAKLSKDSIDLPIHSITHASSKISVLYSIKIKQNALSAQGYEFLQRMKKNTESTGTLFDAQPSELAGNIHSKTAPAEIVIGYIDVADVNEKRIFISPAQLNNWGYRTGCTEIEIPNIQDSVRANSYLMPTSVAKLTLTGDIATFFASQPSCVDCTLSGINVKPSFWP
jgi:hypothetical protein